MNQEEHDPWNTPTHTEPSSEEENQWVLWNLCTSVHHPFCKIQKFYSNREPFKVAGLHGDSYCDFSIRCIKRPNEAYVIYPKCEGCEDLNDHEEYDVVKYSEYLE